MKINIFIIFLIFFLVPFVFAQDNLTEDFTIVTSQIRVTSECWIESSINITELNENITDINEIVLCKNNLTINTNSNKEPKDYIKNNVVNITDETFDIDIIRKLSCEQSSIANLTEVCQETLNEINQDCIVENENNENESKDCRSAYNIYKDRTLSALSKAKEYDICLGNITEKDNAISQKDTDINNCNAEKGDIQEDLDKQKSNGWLYALLGGVAVFGAIQLWKYSKKPESEQKGDLGATDYEQPRDNPIVKKLADDMVKKFREKMGK